MSFKKSVAVAAAKNAEMTAISKAEDGLVQIVVDNCDADLASPNGNLVLLTQPDVNTLQKWLKKPEMTQVISLMLSGTMSQKSQTVQKACSFNESYCPYGWMKEESTKSLRPTTVPVVPPLSPTSILGSLAQVKPHASRQDVDVTMQN